jgi:DNA gyrase subunit A
MINGAAGIAVGMATNMAPHNMTEVIHACLPMQIIRIFRLKD